MIDVAMRMTAALCTDVGRIRVRNEDAAYVDPDGQFFIVADGMGGHAAGDVASRMAVEQVKDTLDAARVQIAAFAASPTVERRAVIASLLEHAVRAAHDAVHERGRRETEKHGMGTTIEVAVIGGAELVLAHAGDSRTYLVRDGKIEQVTRDHTMAYAMLVAGSMTPEEARVSPLSAMLVNAVGVEKDVMVDIVHRTLLPGDRLLLCSDGLTDMVGDERIAEVMRLKDPHSAAAVLTQAALEAGGHDNITCVVVDVVDGPVVVGDGRLLGAVMDLANIVDPGYFHRV